MAAITSGGSTTGHLADTVEAAIDAEDIVPLVSLYVRRGLEMPQEHHWFEDCTICQY